MIGYGTQSLLTPRFLECISPDCATARHIEWSGMVQRQDTSVAPSLRVTCGRVVTLSVPEPAAPGRSFVSVVLSGARATPSIRSGVCCCRCARRRPAQNSKLLQVVAHYDPQRAAGGTLPEPILACQTLSRLPVPGRAWGLKPHLNPAASVIRARTRFNPSTTLNQPHHQLTAHTSPIDLEPGFLAFYHCLFPHLDFSSFRVVS